MTTPAREYQPPTQHLHDQCLTAYLEGKPVCAECDAILPEANRITKENRADPR